MQAFLILYKLVYFYSRFKLEWFTGMTTSLFKNHRDIRRDSMIDEFKTIKSKKLYK